MAEEKGLNKPVKLKADLAAFLGAKSLPRTEITKSCGITSRQTNYKPKQLTVSRKTQARILWLMLN